MSSRSGNHRSEFTFRPLTRADFPLLADWLAAAHVARWWAHETTPEALEDDFGDTVDGLEAAEDFIVEADGLPIGLIQFCYFSDYPEYVDELAEVYPVDEASASIDYLIGSPDHVGRGVGTAMIRAFVERVWSTESRATNLVVPVHSDNRASWKALLSAGFRLVARGELEPDNPIDNRRHEILRLDRPAASPPSAH